MREVLDKKFVIYGLFDPDTKDIRYVGITSRSVISRLSEHLRKAKKGKTYKDRWVAKLLSNGKVPLLCILYTASSFEEVKALEICFIFYFRNSGHSLVNTTDGGDGALGLKHSEEYIKRLVLRCKGKKLSENHKLAIRKGNIIPAMLGKHHSEKTKQILRDKSLGQVSSQRKKVMCINTGEEYPSLMEAGKQLKISYKCIHKQIYGLLKTYKGLRFKYILKGE
jgi:hypothetical protein